MEHVTVDHLELDSLERRELEHRFSGWLQSGETGRVVVTPNPEMYLASRKDVVFARVLNSADLRLIDGIGLVHASAALHGVVVQRNTGVDALDQLARVCAELGKSMLLIGGANDDVALAAARYFEKRYVGLSITAFSPGAVELQGDDVVYSDVVLKRMEGGAFDVVAVGLGMKKQEYFISHFRRRFPEVGVWIGVGGAIDMAAGIFARAPRSFRVLWMEWLWRLMIQPSRFVRVFRAVVYFPALIIWYTLRQGRFVVSVRNFIKYFFGYL